MEIVRVRIGILMSGEKFNGSISRLGDVSGLWGSPNGWPSGMVARDPAAVFCLRRAY